MRVLFRQTIQDRSGNALVGALVDVYEPGTTRHINAVMWDAYVGGGELANPLTADRSGDVFFFLDVPQYIDIRASFDGREHTFVHLPVGMGGPLPWYVRLFVPSDMITGTVINSPSGDYERADAEVALRMLATRFNAWLMQAGYKLNIDSAVFVGQHPLAHYQENNDLTSAADVDGWGISFDRRAEWLFEDPSYATIANSFPPNGSYTRFRASVIFVGGGGYAEGSLTALGGDPTTNRGFATVGDPQFSPMLTGQQDPYSIRNNLPDDGKAPGRAWSHEQLNMLGLKAYSEESFNDEPFSVPGFYAPLQAGFGLFPLGGVLPPPDGQPAFEQMLYPGHIAQLVKYSSYFIQEI